MDEASMLVVLQIFTAAMAFYEGEVDEELFRYMVTAATNPEAITAAYDQAKAYAWSLHAAPTDTPS